MNPTQSGHSPTAPRPDTGDRCIELVSESTSIAARFDDRVFGRSEALLRVFATP